MEEKYEQQLGYKPEIIFEMGFGMEIEGDYVTRKTQGIFTTLS